MGASCDSQRSRRKPAKDSVSLPSTYTVYLTLLRIVVFPHPVFLMINNLNILSWFGAEELVIDLANSAWVAVKGIPSVTVPGCADTLGFGVGVKNRLIDFMPLEAAVKRGSRCRSGCVKFTRAAYWNTSRTPSPVSAEHSQ